VAGARDDRLDRHLFRDLADGRSSALAALYDRHATSLFRHGLALTRRREEAEDLVHTVFMKLATTGAPLLGVRAPASYLHRALRTAWIDGRRRQATGERAIERAGNMEWWTAAPEAASFDVPRALDDLPAEQREVVVLHVLSGFSFREIGAQTGVSLFTAAARYRLAMAKLRLALRTGSEGVTS
jgi:RNA polymerase sigma-70 factor (ECF subfamily)